MASIGSSSSSVALTECVSSLIVISSNHTLLCAQVASDYYIKLECTVSVPTILRIYPAAALLHASILHLLVVTLLHWQAALDTALCV